MSVTFLFVSTSGAELRRIGDAGASRDTTQHHERLGGFVKERVKGQRDNQDHEWNHNPEPDKEKSGKVSPHQQKIKYCEKAI